MKPILQIGAALALAAAGLAAEAKVINHANYIGNFTFSGSATVTVPVSNGRLGDVFALNVNAPAAGGYLLTYSAECAVDAPEGDKASYLDIDLLVNGEAVSPTAGVQDALCTTDGSAGFNRWVRRSITVGVFLHAGANTVEVLARLHNAALGGWLGDGTVIVYQ